MDLSGLATLKERLVEATDFAEVWDYFMTNFGERRGFMSLGQPYRSRLLEVAIAESSKEVFGSPVPITNLTLIRLPEHRFVHGALQVLGRFANVFYFEDIGVGLLTIVLSSLGDNRLVRFTASTQSGGELGRN